MVTRLSKKFITEQKLRLEKEIPNLEKRIEELKKDDPFSDPDHASDNAAVDTDVREQVGHDTIEAQIKDLQRRLFDIKLALNKIQKETYGQCEKCKIQIPINRLKLIPEAIYCVECENKIRQ